MKNKKRTLSPLSMTVVAVFAALICVCSWIAIPSPFSAGVPFTLQTYAIILTGLLLSPIHSALASLVYLLLGVAGLPVFANFHTLYTNLFSPSGGYIIGLLIVPFVISICRYFFERIIIRHISSPVKRKTITAVIFVVLSTVLGIVLIDLPGVIVLSAVTGMDFGAASVAGALAFLPTDIIKCISAALTAMLLKKPLNKITGLSH